MEDKTLENLVKNQESATGYLKAIIEDKALLHVEIDGENRLVCYSRQKLEAAGIKEKTYFRIVPYKDEDSDEVKLNFIPDKEALSTEQSEECTSTTTRISIGSWWHKQKN